MRLPALLISLACLALGAAPATAAPHHSASAPAPATVIADPQAFVAGVYAHLQRGGDYAPPEGIYSPRLAALWADMKHDAGDEVGRVDFEFWINGQDGDIANVTVTAQPVEQHGTDRRIVIAKFTNSGRPEELHLYFEKLGGRWRLDDVRSLKGDDGGWTLSLMLKYGFDSPQP